MFSLLPHITIADHTLAVVSSALLAHFIFNRWEPINVPIVSTLLFAIPAALSTLSVAHNGLLKGVMLTFMEYYATLTSSIVLYRISPIHPLARYPGPFLARVTRWYWTLGTLKGQNHIRLKELHERYGEVVRFGPNEVSIRDKAAIQPMMGTPGYAKGPGWLGRSLHNPVLPLIGLRDNEEHSRRREPWDRAFSSAALREYEPVVVKRAAEFVDILVERKAVDFARWAFLFTFDIMSDALFGNGAQVMLTNDKDGLAEAMVEGFASGTIFEHTPWLGYYVRILLNLGIISNKAFKFSMMCRSRGAERIKRGSTTKDLFYYLNNEDGAEKVTPPPVMVISESALAVIAGSDTTASVLSNTIHSLLTHPETYKRLQAEVDRYYPPEDDALNPIHYPKMVYLDAIIKEALRLYPVVPSGSQRAVPKGSGGASIGPYYIPEGTAMRVHFWSVQRDPRNFSHPDAFYPDRWLIADGLQEPKEPLVHDMNAFIPFSFGPWNCVGKNMAMLEMKMLLTHMLQKVEIRFQSGYDPADWFRNMEDKYVLGSGPLPIVVEKRH